jgi:hypothetical protein
MRAASRHSSNRYGHCDDIGETLVYRTNAEKKHGV